VAGLSAGIHAAKNGYDTTVLEMHELPGGLCSVLTGRWAVQTICAADGKEFVATQSEAQLRSTTGV
jgi:flavin-dependent dehydrogenase